MLLDGDTLWPDLTALRCTLLADAVETDDGDLGRLLLVRIDSPRGELLDTAVFADLDQLGLRLAASPEIRGVVITGPRPGVFVPHFRLVEIAEGAEAIGVSLPWSAARAAYVSVAALARVPGLQDVLLSSPAAGLAELARTHRALDRLAALPQVVVAAIDGDALAGGCEIALACDLRVMSRGDGRIGLVEVTAAIPPGAGGTQRLSRTVGSVRARSMMLRATTLDADEARAAGLVDEAVDAADVLPAAVALAAEVARRSPEAIVAVKRAVTGGRAWRSAIAREAAGFVSTASGSRAIARLRRFDEESSADGRRTPWRDRTWLP
ncbi:MAG: enoyl-CoA hydratase/isomerase family protein [Candidatus Nanopelagicales bacterium]